MLSLLLLRPGEVVTRDELRSQIWHSDTFVDFDNGLNTSINRLRDALGDSANNPRFIETLPKRGYRFIADVTTTGAEISVTPQDTQATSPRSQIVVMTITILGAVILLGGGLLWRWRQTHRLTKTDTMVVADFTNSTGDPVFDGSLRRGLSVQLEQSPFLSLLPEQQIQQTLRLMKQPADARLTPGTALEVCQRTGTTIALDGSISQIGNQYSLILRAVSCSDDRSITSTEAFANDKTHVLEALGTASYDIRRKLGESLATVQKYDTPLVQATTSSLEALKLYSLGYRALTGKGDSAAALPFLQQATKLDPNFAMAYVLLGAGYWNLGENTLASESIRKAFELRAGLSESERLRIESEYHCLVTCNLSKAERALEVWAQTYPRDWGPRNRLGVVYLALGEYDKANAILHEALSLNPQSGLIRGNLIVSYIALNRVEEARAVVEEAKVKNPDSPGLLVNLYRLAFLENDVGEMKRLVASATGRPGLEDELLWNEAATASFFGKMQEARTIYRDAIASAERADEKEAAAAYETDQALRETQFGIRGDMRQRIASALRLANGPDVQYQAALALALVGDLARAQALTQDLTKRFPEDTIVQTVFLPTLNAQLALSHKDASRALEALQPALSYEMGASLYPAYIRGIAYLTVHREREAATEFQKILEHRGVVLNSPIGALAHLQIARAFVQQGDMTKARVEYQDFLNLWKDGDPDIPILKQAKAEFERMKG